MKVVIKWEPFMLRPNTPIEGYPKGGTPESRVGATLRTAGEAVGIEFTGLTDRTPNTELFHACMKALEETPDVATAFQTAAFEGYFTLGAFPDEAGLLECAKKADGAESTLTALFRDTDRLDALRTQAKQEAMEIRMSGVSSVPFFFFATRPVFSGARDVDDFVGALRAFSQPLPLA